MLILSQVQEHQDEIDLHPKMLTKHQLEAICLKEDSTGVVNKTCTTNVHK
jgi:hypothetical protein